MFVYFLNHIYVLLQVYHVTILSITSYNLV